MSGTSQKLTGETWDDFLPDCQSIDDDHCNYTTGNLAMTLINNAGKANFYVRFGYDLNKSLYHTRGQVSGSMEADKVNEKTQIKNQQRRHLVMKMKDILDQSKNKLIPTSMNTQLTPSPQPSSSLRRKKICV